MTFIDMTGWIMKEHGVLDSKITILCKDTDTSKKSNWICKCECGKTFSANGSKIRSGWTRSCGCLQRKVTSERTRADLTGRRFGKLTVIKPIGTYGHSVLWECQCDCGNIKNATSNNLLSKQTHSCGCIKSYGEFLISNFLKEHNIEYKTEYSLGNLKNIPKSCARVDFAIFKEGILKGFIEVDGIQHYDTDNSWFNHGVQENDLLKENYAYKNNIPLLRLFYESNKIDFNILINFLQSIGVT